MSDTQVTKPTPEGEERAVLDTLYRMLETVTHRDKEAMRQLLVPDGCAVQSRDHQVTYTALRDFPDKMPGGTADLMERFYEPLVRVDDDIAMVWARYDFLVDGKVHHWGTNILSFLKQDGHWRVSAVTDNGRTGARPKD
jgi:hypothetical protein